MKYLNSNSGYTILAGKVTGVDGNVMVMDVPYYERGNKEQKHEEVIIKNVPENKVKVGFTATAVGFQHGNSDGKKVYQAEAVLVNNEIFEKDDFCVIHGSIQRAALNEEKDENGQPKMNKENKAKKPHYDISFNIKEADGNYRSHRIKIYDSPNQTDAIEQAKKMFGRVGQEKADGDGNVTVNRVVGTFVTEKGREYSIQNGEYTNLYSDHMGLKKKEFEYVQVPKKEREKTAEEPAPTPAPAEVSHGDGFMNAEDEMDVDLPFN